MRNGVARQAEVVLDMQRGTMYGPTRFTPLVRIRSAASTWFCGEPPPEPTISPLRSFDTMLSGSPASAMAWVIAI